MKKAIDTAAERLRRGLLPAFVCTFTSLVLAGPLAAASEFSPAPAEEGVRLRCHIRKELRADILDEFTGGQQLALPSGSFEFTATIYEPAGSREPRALVSSLFTQEGSEVPPLPHADTPAMHSRQEQANEPGTLNPLSETAFLEDFLVSLEAGSSADEFPDDELSDDDDDDHADFWQDEDNDSEATAGALADLDGSEVELKVTTYPDMELQPFHAHEYAEADPVSRLLVKQYGEVLAAAKYSQTYSLGNPVGGLVPSLVIQVLKDGDGKPLKAFTQGPNLTWIACE